MNRRFAPETFVGVDFSGAALAGRNVWLATARPLRRGKLRLDSLDCLESLAGAADRDAALGHLVRLVMQSQSALWAMDFPFALPIEIVDPGTRWTGQIDLVRRWGGDAQGFGRWCVARARALGGKLHIRRETDRITRTPFDCYHYRIIYQTFHGMRDVLASVADDRSTAVVPFNRINGSTRRVVVEACPGSTLKRLGLPHQMYKQPTGGALTRRRRMARHAILDGLQGAIQIDERFRRRIMRNPGGDALDAVIAAVGASAGWREWSAGRTPALPRYLLEGLIFA